MRIWTIILAGILSASCNSDPTKENNIPTDRLNSNTVTQDSILTLSFKQIIKDSAIVNTTDRTIEVLFNGVDGFLDGERNRKLNFKTECMVCESFQPYDNGLIFGKRLYIEKDFVKIYPKDVNISDTAKIIKTFNFYGDTKKKVFDFGNGKVTMKYQGQSCNDAVYVKINLKYDKGSIEISNLINASFFEYDLDNDGEMEQYLFGTRNCSQELVILRITKPKTAIKL